MTPELNFYPVTQDANFSGTPSLDNPQPNTPNLPLSGSNITPGPDGTVMNGGTFQSPNYARGASGWKIDSNGNVEFGSGYFRGDITGASGTFSGTLTGGSLNIPDTTTANSFHVDSSGNAWWGATTLGASTGKVLNTGAGTFSSMTITGGSISGTTTVGIGNVNIAARGWTQTSIFSVTDADTIAWGAGTFTSADGTAYSIGSGNTGNMTLATYIYLDIAVSTVAYQTTTTASTAVGAGKVLIAKAQNGTGEATFQVFGGIGGQNIDASSIVANSITANELSTSITYAGTIVISTSGNIRSGQTAFNTGTGWFIGNDSGTAKFSIGDGTATNSMTWDGTTLLVNGSSITGQVLYGDGSDGIVTISSNTSLTRDMYYNNLTINAGFTLNTGGYKFFVKGTLTVNNTGKIARDGLTGGNGADGTAAGGTGGVPAAALAAGTLAGALAGKAGGDGSAIDSAGSNGGAGTNITESYGVNGVAGVGGGAGNSGGASSGGTAGTVTAAVSGPRNLMEASLMRNSQSGSFNQITSSASSGGSGGGGGRGGGPDGGGGGGASGGVGGMMFFAAKTIVNNGIISVNGGKGGNGGSGRPTGTNCGGGGAGSGGSGGVLVYIYRSKSGSGTYTATGGSPGTIGQGIGNPAGTPDASRSGSAGNSGNDGVVVAIQE